MSYRSASDPHPRLRRMRPVYFRHGPDPYIITYLVPPRPDTPDTSNARDSLPITATSTTNSGLPASARPQQPQWQNKTAKSEKLRRSQFLGTYAERNTTHTISHSSLLGGGLVAGAVKGDSEADKSAQKDDDERLISPSLKRVKGMRNLKDRLEISRPPPVPRAAAPRIRTKKRMRVGMPAIEEQTEEEDEQSADDSEPEICVSRPVTFKKFPKPPEMVHIKAARSPLTLLEYKLLDIAQRPRKAPKVEARVSSVEPVEGGNGSLRRRRK